MPTTVFNAFTPGHISGVKVLNTVVGHVGARESATTVRETSEVCTLGLRNI